VTALEKNALTVLTKKTDIELNISMKKQLVEEKDAYAA